MPQADAWLLMVAFSVRAPRWVKARVMRRKAAGSVRRFVAMPDSCYAHMSFQAMRRTAPSDLRASERSARRLVGPPTLVEMNTASFMSIACQTSSRSSHARLVTCDCYHKTGESRKMNERLFELVLVHR